MTNCMQAMQHSMRSDGNTNRHPAATTNQQPNQSILSSYFFSFVLPVSVVHNPFIIRLSASFPIIL